MTLLYTDPIFLEHDTGHHPECLERLLAITEAFRESGLDKRCKLGTFQPLSEDAVAHIHSREMIARAKQACQHGRGHLDADTIVCGRSFEVALAAAGACVSAVDAVLKGIDRTAFCLVRPPGHHATPTQSMGFCLFDNIALAADHARRAFGLTRILIVDFDVHHGNGTQDIFYEDPEVLFFSVHRYGYGFYPGTGARDETGAGKGLGYTINVPLRHGISDKEYVAAYEAELERAADHIKPELVLISAGFDAHVRDPIGSLGLESENFATLTSLVLDVAKTHAQGRVVSCLEGGYHLDALAESVQAHLEELLRGSG